MNNEENKSEEYVVPGRFTKAELEKEKRELEEGAKLSKSTPPKGLLSSMTLMNAGFDFLVIIAGPLIIAVLLRKYVNFFSQNELYFIILVFASIVVSAVGVWQQIKKYQNYLKNK